MAIVVHDVNFCLADLGLNGAVRLAGLVGSLRSFDLFNVFVVQLLV